MNKINNNQSQAHNQMVIKLINLMINQGKTKGMHSINYNRKKRKLYFSFRVLIFIYKGYVENE